MTDTIDDYGRLKGDCWDSALQTFGYGHIFNKRAQRFSRRINLVTVFGILAPTLIGATVLGYGIENDILTKFIAIAIPVTIVQFLFSVVAIIYKWNEELSYSFEASQAYGSLSSRFKKLAKFPPSDFNEFSKNFEFIDIEYSNRDQQNSTHNVREWELRRGMRYALREFQRPCAGCNNIPKSMKSTDCPVCGNYTFTYKLLNK